MRNKLVFIVALMICCLLTATYLISWPFLPKEEIHNIIGFHITLTNLSFFIISLILIFWFFGSIILNQRKKSKKRTAFTLHECWK